MKDDWIEATLGDICKFIGGGTPRKSDSNYWNGEIPWASIKDIKGSFLNTTVNTITQKGLENSSANLAYVDDIILATRINPGRPIFSRIVVAINQDLKVVKPKIEINKRFLFHGFQALEKEVLKKSSGTTVLGINLNNLNELPFSFPPLPEQRNIVAKIEQLFSELDNGIANLKTAQEQLKVYRQAVLKKAFEGGFSDKSYDLRKINSICEVVRGGSPRPAGSIKFYDGPIPFMKVKDISRNKGVYVDKAEYSIKEAGLKKTRQVSACTLLLTNSGATLGVPAITKIETTFNDGIAAFLGLEKDDLLYHYYYWESKTKYLRNINQGAAQPNLNTSVIGQMEIPIYEDKSEHNRIVQHIESRLSVCDKVEETIAENLQKAEALRQSILKKAFAGELLTEAELTACKKEPDWEPAGELLKRIKKEKTKS